MSAAVDTDILASSVPPQILAMLGLSGAPDAATMIERSLASGTPPEDGATLNDLIILLEGVIGLVYRRDGQLRRRAAELGIGPLGLVRLGIDLVLSPPPPPPGPVRIDTDARRAFLNGKELELTPKEFDLLVLLMCHAGTVLPRAEIMRKVWGPRWSGSSRNIDMHICWLRRKLGDDAHHPQLITTIRGIGFRFEKPDQVA